MDDGPVRGSDTNQYKAMKNAGILHTGTYYTFNEKATRSLKEFN